LSSFSSCSVSCKRLVPATCDRCASAADTPRRGSSHLHITKHHDTIRWKRKGEDEHGFCVEKRGWTLTWRAVVAPSTGRGCTGRLAPPPL
jgi:hypothetical protein